MSLACFEAGVLVINFIEFNIRQLHHGFTRNDLPRWGLLLVC